MPAPIRPPPMPEGKAPPADARGPVRARKQGGRAQLGDMLLRAGLINEAKLEQALSMAHRNNERLGDVLVKSGFARPEDIARALAQQFRIDYLEPKHLTIAMVDRDAVQQAGVK